MCVCVCVCVHVCMCVHKRFCVYGYIYVRFYVCIVYVRDRDECVYVAGAGGCKCGERG